MILTELLSTGRTLLCTEENKKRAIKHVSEVLANDLPDMADNVVFDALMARERLGSTAVGHGVALPHARLEGIEAPIGLLMGLNESIDFEASDGEPVKLIFALLVPEEATEAHLQILAGLAKLFSNEQFRQALLQAQDCHALYQNAVNFSQ